MALDSKPSLFFMFCLQERERVCIVESRYEGRTGQGKQSGKLPRVTCLSPVSRGDEPAQSSSSRHSRLTQQAYINTSMQLVNSYSKQIIGGCLLCTTPLVKHLGCI